MYAMVDFGGIQFKAVPGTKIFVDNQNRQNGEVFEHTKVLLVADGDEIKVGRPYVEGARVKLEVIDTFKGKKVIVFKKRRRKGSKVKKGHRSLITALKVVEIVK